MQFWLAVAFLPTEDLLDVARAADAAGYHGITVSDHVFAPEVRTSLYPYSRDGAPMWAPDTAWPDPWATIAAMAAVTTRLRFTTNVYVAPARDVFTVAKLVSTAAVLSGERVALGAAPGWCREEFDQLGQDFTNRGRRLEEMVEVLRSLWRGGFVEHRGPYYDFDPLQIAPVPPSPVPVYIGGDSDVALRRAARIGDGWIGNAYTEDAAAGKLAALRRELAAAGRDEAGFETILALKAMPSVELYRRWAGEGVTGTICAPWMMAEAPTPEARLAAIERFAEDVVAAT